MKSQSNRTHVCILSNLTNIIFGHEPTLHGVSLLLIVTTGNSFFNSEDGWFLGYM
ncbi:Uncharacterized protein TCM_002464 [Theobroma cacao]|uniref:Uncharacterized protein n=1 Tax=Theobroma cacao TaxID=3641 RepID=A0A061DLL0_THECC|nr:Uncharacterized protein TCM_002464 [Theobroma cacao]